MVSLAKSMPNVERGHARPMENWVLLLALACLLVARMVPALSFKAMAMMPMQIDTASIATPATDATEQQSRPNCFDDALRCMGMMGGLCPFAATTCIPEFAARWLAPQAQSPLHLVDPIGSSLWSSVPKQPPRR